jgi:hypothetical protein
MIAPALYCTVIPLYLFYAEGQNKNGPARVYFDLLFCVKSVNSVNSVSTKEGKIKIDTANVCFNLLFCFKSVNSVKSTKKVKLQLMWQVCILTFFFCVKSVKEG